ncbi:response regulator [Rhodoblastus sp.]|jgi:CheY-like chemotaxis protein|uniref:response regulator n=1 Tax=Rhodoblastus sp. TaxID=1962975 RepID=UPI0025EE44C8|nr:response regulator [Rhodoblastus sp.]
MDDRHQTVTIVMIEDDAGHARLIEKNIRRAAVCNEIVGFNNGAEALEYLQPNGTEPHPAAHRPLLILLDLNLPDMSGLDILARLKGNEHTRRFPIIVLTTTDDSREIEKCYDLGANAYITKPLDYDNFSTAIRQLGLFLAVIQIPEMA